jgi:hypothetical protein
MAEISQLFFTYKEVAEALVKQHGLHEGVWSVAINFGLKATNIGESQTDLKPAAIIPILAIGLQKAEKETNLTVDAAKVNPRPKTKHN